ncbi:hypothetical protein M426DRAFT_8123 [Hypoxylon sp. CI-4A]|nr:hypothetical protein M426DRAFT_8123 [Hypoxylon sp. CI-4A]
MAEIPNSESPDPLTSTPPPNFMPARSFPSTIGNTDSPVAESSPIRQTLPRPRQRFGLHQSSSPVRTEALPPMPSSDYFDDFPYDLDPYQPESSLGGPSSDHNNSESSENEYQVDLDSEMSDSRSQYSTDESLFVNDHNDDGSPNMDRTGSPDLFGFIPQSPGASSEPGHFMIDDDLLDDLIEVTVELGQQQGPVRGNPRVHQARAEPEVIDLTGDNEGPAPPTSQQRSQNARRQRSQQRGTPPRLARSDAGYMGSHTVIDLISDSDDEPVEMPPPRRSNSARQGNRQEPRPEPAQRLTLPEPRNYPDQFPDFHRPFGFMHHIHIRQVFQGVMDNNNRNDVIVTGANQLPNAAANPDLPVRLDYVVHPFQNPPQAPGGAPKPAHEPPKETRKGFTRNTGEDVVAICPSCDQELAYDPEEDGNPPPSKRARTKKSQAEHHFWAVKACGHVYCKKCFDNRRPSGKNPAPVGFRPDPSAGKKMLCAVEDCDSEVSIKSAWVGIFL